MSNTIELVEEDKPKLAARFKRASKALSICESWLIDSHDKYAHTAAALKVAKTERADIENDVEAIIDRNRIGRPVIVERCDGSPYGPQQPAIAAARR